MFFVPNCSFSPFSTFESGQCFRWDAFENGYRGVVGNHVLTVTAENGGITIDGISENDFENIHRYLTLDIDYDAIRRELSELDPILADAVKHTDGLHLLRQDSWEALCSFLISQNNNIPRIKGIIKRMCELYGEHIADGYYSFPSAERLAELSAEDLAPLRCGYRAAYLIDASKRVSSGTLSLSEVSRLPLPQAREKLQTVLGVGPKVAECVLLYGMGRWDAFPIDVWMKRVMASHFPSRSPEFFGSYAGLAQQYLFCMIRDGALPF